MGWAGRAGPATDRAGARGWRCLGKGMQKESQGCRSAVRSCAERQHGGVWESLAYGRPSSQRTCVGERFSRALVHAAPGARAVWAWAGGAGGAPFAFWQGEGRHDPVPCPKATHPTTPLSTPPTPGLPPGPALTGDCASPLPKPLWLLCGGAGRGVLWDASSEHVQRELSGQPLDGLHLPPAVCACVCVCKRGRGG